MSEPSAYLAGKVYGSGDWRREILSRYRAVAATDPRGDPLVPGRQGFVYYEGCPLPVLDGDTFEDHAEAGRPPLIKLDAGFSYAGPYYQDLCGGHGVDNERLEVVDHACGADRDVKAHDPRTVPRGRIYSMCVRGLEQSTHVFAWIDSPTAYGTFAELGMAALLGKPVYAAFSRDAELLDMADDLWFSLYNATLDRVNTGAPVAAFDSFSRWMNDCVGSEYRDVGHREVDRRQRPATIGQPAAAEDVPAGSASVMDSFDEITTFGLSKADSPDLPGEIRCMLSLLEDCKSGGRNRGDYAVASAKSLSYAGRLAGLDDRTRQRWIRLAGELGIRQNHAGHMISRLKKDGPRR